MLEESLNNMHAPLVDLVLSMKAFDVEIFYYEIHYCLEYFIYF